MITREIWDEYFNTDSIKRKGHLAELIQEAISEYLNKKIKPMTWWFNDAPEGDIGTLESSLCGSEIEINYILASDNEDHYHEFDAKVLFSDKTKLCPHCGKKI